MTSSGPSSLFRFCPYDGRTLADRPDDDGTPRPTCDACGFIDYHNPRPCAGAIIVKDGRALLARRAHEPAKGRWDVPGGFVETGESAEDATIREIREETNLDIRITGYVGSVEDFYGGRARPTLNIYFLAEVIGGDMRPDSDVAELAWFAPDQFPEPLAFDHQAEIIAKWRAGNYSPM